MQKTQEFVWETANPKIKHDILCKSNKQGGLNNTYMPEKIVSLQYSRKRRFYGNQFHEWILILLHLIAKSFEKILKLHFNLSFNFHDEGRHDIETSH